LKEHVFHEISLLHFVSGRSAAPSAIGLAPFAKPAGDCVMLRHWMVLVASLQEDMIGGCDDHGITHILLLSCLLLLWETRRLGEHMFP
jgi:hypothetical protein